MSKPRGRPNQGKGIDQEAILATALELLEAGGEAGLTMRSLASRLGVTPMSLYNHVEDRVDLLRKISDRVYSDVALDSEPADHPLEPLRLLLSRYFDAVARYPQLTLAIFSEPRAFAGVTRLISERLTALLEPVTAEPSLWRDILVDHAHGCGIALALSTADGGPVDKAALQAQYALALDRLLARIQGEQAAPPASG
ncbi:TetR/AcrR family transcriptional regulator [Pseudomonas chlororaphis]|uniref:TetR/AcrR family transcriptional regulator n=1 Tax=Pseudomonas chlororaphis TaxID=587753 RepID=UPI001E2AF798|nr:TetR/AcrR family transcriptional regulator [Pseudomonas chlororaphis]MCB2252198.1 TetR/AcrR family transcriptional regulator [Pseudomonas chlororaphis]